MVNNKHQLLCAVQMYDFYLCELRLYLDTHPACPSGLRAYRKYKELRENAVSAYTAAFGPLTPEQSECSSVFDWAKGPWPWEKEAN